MDLIYVVVLVVVSQLFYIWVFSRCKNVYNEQISELKAKNEQLSVQNRKLDWENALLNVINITFTDYKLIKK